VTQCILSRFGATTCIKDERVQAAKCLANRADHRRRFIAFGEIRLDDQRPTAARLHLGSYISSGASTIVLLRHGQDVEPLGR